MDVLHSRCCGLDVHKSSISACILVQEAERVQKHQRRFGAMTQDLQLANLAQAVRGDAGSDGVQRAQLPLGAKTMRCLQNAQQLRRPDRAIPRLAFALKSARLRLRGFSCQPIPHPR